jgi:hypothetical protein
MLIKTLCRELSCPFPVNFYHQTAELNAGNGRELCAGNGRDRSLHNVNKNTYQCILFHVHDLA